MMDICSWIEQDLKIPNKCCRKVSTNRFTCLVHKRWLNAIRNQKIPSEESFADLDATEAELSLTPSYNRVPLTRLRVSIKVIPKSERMVRSLVNSPLSMDKSVMEDIPIETKHKFVGGMRPALSRYKSALHNLQTEPNVYPHKNFNALLRETLRRRFNCRVASLRADSSSHGHAAEATRGSPADRQVALAAAHAVVESGDAFYVVQRYERYTLHDLVTFSPAALQRHHDAPLFVFYQVLRAVRCCHLLGLSAGRLRPRDFAVDDKSWLKLMSFDASAVSSEIQIPVAADDDDERARTRTGGRGTSAMTDHQRYASEDLPSLVERWVVGGLSNFDYLMVLNRLAGRQLGDPNHHPVLPWVTDFATRDGAPRDLSATKFRLNKGDRQLDLTFATAGDAGDAADDSLRDQRQIAHHVTDFLSDITYYVYKARTTPKAVLCSHVRRTWVPHEYPSSMQRMYAWTPDECIPEFYVDPAIFASVHDDLPDLELPAWAADADDFIAAHQAALESDAVSSGLHAWIDLTFGYKLSGLPAVQAKNVCLQLVDDHVTPLNYGVVQLFTQPHPPRGVRCRDRHHDDTDKKQRTTKARKRPASDRNGSAADVPEAGTITLPRGYEPLATLDQLEALYSFTLATAKRIPPPTFTKPHLEDERSRLFVRDMKSVGCLAVELFLPQRMRVLSDDASFNHRYTLARSLCEAHISEIPRSLRRAVRALLGLEDWSGEGGVAGGNEGPAMPGPSSLLAAIPFPSHFPPVYALLSRLRALRADGADSAGRRQVALLSAHLSAVGDGVTLVLPYVCELLRAGLGACELTGPTAGQLGPARRRCLLPLLLRLHAPDTPPTAALALLHHRRFVLTLLVHFGVATVLRHFVAPLVEACAGFRDVGVGEAPVSGRVPAPSAGDDDAAVPTGAGAGLARAVHDDRGSADGRQVAQRDERGTSLDEVPSSDEPSSSLEDGQTTSLDAQSTSLVGRQMTSSEDGQAESTVEERMTSLDDGPIRSLDDRPIRSLDDGSPVDASTASLDDDATSDDATSDDASREAPSAADAATVSSMVRSETAEFRGRQEAGVGVGEVAAETVKWLAHRLGPLLTARCLSRRLLRMLTICFLGDAQLASVSHEGVVPSTTNEHVAGDVSASRVLDCLSCIAVLYGEQVVLLQYIPHMKDVIATAANKLTVQAEAALIGCISLLTHIVPYLSDSTLMDILQETVVKELLLPLLKLVSSQHVRFPSHGRARFVICHKVVDTLYVLALRVGFEMTRKHMTFVLQKFFAAFSRVYDATGGAACADDGTTSDEDGGSSQGPTDGEKASLEDSLYVEIKMDAATNEYRIGTPVSITPSLDPPPPSLALPPPSLSPSPRSLTPPPLAHRHSLPPANSDQNGDSPAWETSSEQIGDELRQAFSPALAHAAYIPFCKLAGGIHMEQNLINDDLIRLLCAKHDEAESRCLELSQPPLAQAPPTFAGSRRDSEDAGTGKDFGRSSVPGGNRMTVGGEEVGLPAVDARVSRTRSRSGEPPVNYNMLRSVEMEMNKQRHLRGNWLAYWEHELGLGDRPNSFNFKQIQLQTLTGHTASVRSLCVLDNENSFLSGSKDKTIKLWSLRSFGEGLGRQGCQSTYRQHRKAVLAVSFMETPRLAASCDGSVHVWDPFLSRCVRQYESPRSSLLTVMKTLSPPSQCLVTAATDALLRFIDVRCEHFTHLFKASTTTAGLVRCMTVSADGSWLAVGHSSGVISVLDVRTGLMLASWKGHDAEIVQMKAYNNKSFITASFDQCLTLWRVDDGKAICHFKGLPDPVHCVEFYEDKLLTASAANRIGVHSSVDARATFTAAKLRSDTFRGVLTTIAILPQNRLLLLGSDNGLIKLMA